MDGPPVITASSETSKYSSTPSLITQEVADVISDGLTMALLPAAKIDARG